jgi:hypothetical protein
MEYVFIHGGVIDVNETQVDVILLRSRNCVKTLSKFEE